MPRISDAWLDDIKGAYRNILDRSSSVGTQRAPGSRHRLRCSALGSRQRRVVAHGVSCSKRVFVLPGRQSVITGAFWCTWCFRDHRRDDRCSNRPAIVISSSAAHHHWPRAALRDRGSGDEQRYWHEAVTAQTVVKPNQRRLRSRVAPARGHGTQRLHRRHRYRRSDAACPALVDELSSRPPNLMVIARWNIKPAVPGTGDHEFIIPNIQAIILTLVTNCSSLLLICSAAQPSGALPRRRSRAVPR